MYSKTMRIQKYLSEQKILSRRETEEYIRRGLIKVNGEIVKDLGRQIDPAKDKVEIVPNGGGAAKEKTTVAVYKPRGIVSSKIKSEGETIFELLPNFAHLNTVGRLDKESEGLLLLSNDGVVTAAVTGEEHLIEKEYEVTVQENLVPGKLRKMEEGIKLEDGMTLPAETEMLDKHSFIIILKEGRKHQIRRMADAMKLTITSLKRTRIGNIHLGNLKPGQYRILKPSEVNQLKQLAK